MNKFLLLGALLFTMTAHAHTHLKSSDPANASTVATAPKTISLEFPKPVRLSALSIQSGKAAPKKLADLPATPQLKFAVPTPALEAGEQIVEWRAVGDDGHVMSGKIKFTVADAASVAKP